MQNNLWIVDFGSQYSQLIVRSLREEGYKGELLTVTEAITRFKNNQTPRALILSGGPQSVFEDETDYSSFFKNENLPVLGICYGMQILGKYFGGIVSKGIIGEYGKSLVSFTSNYQASGCPKSFNAWMSHADHVEVVPKEFELIITSQNDLVAGIKHKSRPILGLQFHPEVQHTEHGKDIIKHFVVDIAKLTKDWSSTTMMEECCEVVKSAKPEHVLCAFSGGVDSLVAAQIVHKIIGKKLFCFFIDNGLLRPQDYNHIHLLKEKTDLQIEIVDVKDLFLNALVGVADPEAKRKIIGKTFIEAFEKKVDEFQKNKGIKFSHLLQGTLYPDVIESISPHVKDGKSVTIKSHHNVGGLPERMKLNLLEPLRFLFKDEVRVLGLELGLNREWVFRHPFPGPGIGVRVLGEIKRDSVRMVQEADQILFEELKSSGLYNTTWQAAAILLPVKTVGVKGDGRVYEEVICLRMVNSQDGMTATVTEFPWNFLHKVSSRIGNEVKGITRVVYDLTSKPPGTIEWE
jgi:GMP synthase (glutamine-hydrolysing)